MQPTFLIFALFATTVAAENFAVLVSGSKGYFNYRHQADVGRAYKLLRKNGFPEQNIIVMHADDIANNSRNPFPGTIFNEIDGEDVYDGLPKHYTGADVTPENFLKVISGEKIEGKRVLSTGQNDQIFVFFTDHGSPGLIAFPKSHLYADQLMKTLKAMFEAEKYSKLIFFLETCESGSMFHKLLSDDLRIFAHTAADPYHSSYACDYSSSVKAFLNDCWSRNWMSDTQSLVEKKDHSRTLVEQFEKIQKQTTKSHTCKYGDLSIANDPVVSILTGKLWKMARYRRVSGNRAPEGNIEDMVSSRDVVLETLKRIHGDNSEELNMEMLRREIVDQFFAQLARSFTSIALGQTVDSNVDVCFSRPLTNFDCLRSTVHTYVNTMGQFSDYSLKYVGQLYDLCIPHSGVVESEIVNRIREISANSRYLNVNRIREIATNSRYLNMQPIVDT